MEKIERALDVTDQFLFTVLQDQKRLEDPKFMKFLMALRQKHKETFAEIDKLVDLSCREVSAVENELQIPFEKQKLQCNELTHCANRKSLTWIGNRNCDSTNTSDGEVTYNSDPSTKSGGEDDRRAIQTWGQNGFHSNFLQSSVKTTTEDKWYEQRKIKFIEKWVPHIVSFKTKKTRIKPREVPQSTYEPRYRLLCEKQEKAREERHRRAEEMLKKSHLPRMIGWSESKSFHLRRCVSAETSDWNKREHFKAREIPLSIYVSSYKDKIQAYRRARVRTERAAELIRTSRAPPGLEVR
ncbi:unnamed protein product [Thelazia callipaeda]|uniref:Protein FAM228A n=1 Tax=Thelazia callipaeda TaxID=103827 RepID=A0A0N5DBX0_THECL|nr:unnamed protein product [Thelazia callipaeda]